ncbi:MAG: metal ABC transporter solute-binding protein, Zn/Mn family [Planctomycetota bacterium]
MSRLYALLILPLLLLLNACGPTTKGPPTVAVSVAPQAWLVERLAGDAVRVLTAVPPGASPHSSQPSDAEIAALKQADLYIRTGVPMENGPWFAAITRHMPVADARQGLELLPMTAHAHHDEHGADAHEHHEHDHHDHGHHDHHDHGHHEADPLAGTDPHCWLSPELLREQARTVAEALISTYPAMSEDIKLRLETVQNDLTALDSDLAALLEPYAGRRFYVYHPAWGYFAHRYQLQQVPVEVAGQEPSDSELADLRQRAEADAISTLFVQSQIHGRSAERIAEAVGAELVSIDPLATPVPANLRQVAAALIDSWQTP